MKENMSQVQAQVQTQEYIEPIDELNEQQSEHELETTPTGPSDQPVLNWDDEMVLGNDELDQVHEEFGVLLNQLANTPEDQLLTVLDECIAHTRAHFDLEEGWMARLNFPAAGCHVSEHNQVFGVMQQVRQCVLDGDTQYAYILAKELAAWLRIHAGTMDYALVYFIDSTNADLSQPASAEEIKKIMGHDGCGCGPSD